MFFSVYRKTGPVALRGQIVIKTSWRQFSWLENLLRFLCVYTTSKHHVDFCWHFFWHLFKFVQLNNAIFPVTVRKVSFSFMPHLSLLRSLPLLWSQFKPRCCAYLFHFIYLLITWEAIFRMKGWKFFVCCCICLNYFPLLGKVSLSVQATTKYSVPSPVCQLTCRRMFGRVSKLKRYCCWLVRSVQGIMGCTSQVENRPLCSSFFSSDSRCNTSKSWNLHVNKTFLVIAASAYL